MIAEQVLLDVANDEEFAIYSEERRFQAVTEAVEQLNREKRLQELIYDAADMIEDLLSMHDLCTCSRCAPAHMFVMQFGRNGTEAKKAHEETRLNARTTGIFAG